MGILAWCFALTFFSLQNIYCYSLFLAPLLISFVTSWYRKPHFYFADHIKNTVFISIAFFPYCVHSLLKLIANLVVGDPAAMLCLEDNGYRLSSLVSGDMGKTYIWSLWSGRWLSQPYVYALLRKKKLKTAMPTCTSSFLASPWDASTRIADWQSQMSQQ